MTAARRVTILDLLTDKVDPRGAEALFLKYIGRQYYSIMPQVAAAWCRRRGHQVRYETYFGQTAPDALIDRDCDILFISAYTRASALAYALAKVAKGFGARTVIAGPHATCFPEDAARFFDNVVVSCTEEQVMDLVEGRIGPGEIVTSGKSSIALPSLAERLDDVKHAAFVNGKRSRLSTVSLLTSTGCPYSCSFCSDWNSVYAARGTEEVAADLTTAAEVFPGNIVAFHDPNFGVRFDQTLAAFERIPPKQRNPYVVESSLSLLRSDRIDRLQDTNCSYLAPGVESWYDYGEKAKTSASTGHSKFQQVCDKFSELSEKIPSLQANFLLGDDGDVGQEPIELTKEFISRFPGVFPVINFPMAFGATPLRDELAASGRLLPLPPIHYSSPVMTHQFLNYSMREALLNKVALIDHILSPGLFARRMTRKCPVAAKIFWSLFLFKLASYRRELKGLLRLLDEDEGFRGFHAGHKREVPRYYDERLDRRLGRYAPLLTASDRALEAA
ncbi:MAG: hypothetical protein Kilf2KO_45190 [Rhodospirillales bacterium]